MINVQTRHQLQEALDGGSSEYLYEVVERVLADNLVEIPEPGQPFHNNDKALEISERILGHRYFRRYRARVKHFTVVSVQAIAGVVYAVALNDSAYGWQNGYYRSCLVRADRLLNSKSYLDVTNAC